MKIASIDIGTNTLLLLVMEYKNGQLTIIEDHHKIARLGENLNKTGIISSNAINRATKILEFYKERIIDLDIDHVISCATSAMRDALNSKEVSLKLENIIETKIKIISGDEEARLSYLGSIEFDKNIVIDIGGGSTEIIQGINEKIIHAESVNIGAVRITEMFDLWNKSSDNIVKARNFIKDQLKVFPLNDIKHAIAVAGTPNTLATLHLGIKEYSREKLHMLNMKKSDLGKTIQIVISSSKKDLIEKHGIHENRADVILGGALILDEFMNYFKLDNLYVSSNGLRLES